MYVHTHTRIYVYVHTYVYVCVLACRTVFNALFPANSPHAHTHHVTANSPHAHTHHVTANSSTSAVLYRQGHSCPTPTDPYKEYRVSNMKTYTSTHYVWENYAHMNGQVQDIDEGTASVS